MTVTKGSCVGLSDSDDTGDGVQWNMFSRDELIMQIIIDCQSLVTLSNSNHKFYVIINLYLNFISRIFGQSLHL